MRRIQFCLDDELWETLRQRAEISRSTVSELVRTALREKYQTDKARRIAAMTGIIGLWKDRTDIGDTEEYVRKLRQDRRSQRFAD